MAVTTQIIVVGNLVRDPELRDTSGGKSVVSITVATAPRTFDRESKEWKEGETLFTRCTAWDDTAQHIAHSLRKGDRVIVYGNLKATTWKNREGVEQKGTELQIDEVGPSLRFANATPVKGDHSYTDQIKKADSDGWVVVDDADTPF